MGEKEKKKKSKRHYRRICKKATLYGTIAINSFIIVGSILLAWLFFVIL
ncbi:MAG: hypothetical protein ACTSO4_10795 [Promethearchaeota archaeon]